MQVSPTEIEDTLLAHPEKLIVDVCVVGVPGSRTSDEKAPRAWIVLSELGKMQGEKTVIEKLNAWANTNLSPYKRLRGGFEVIDEVGTKPSFSTAVTISHEEICVVDSKEPNGQDVASRTNGTF